MNIKIKREHPGFDAEKTAALREIAQMVVDEGCREGEEGRSIRASEMAEILRRHGVDFKGDLVFEGARHLSRAAMTIRIIQESHSNCVGMLALAGAIEAIGEATGDFSGGIKIEKEGEG